MFSLLLFEYFVVPCLFTFSLIQCCFRKLALLCQSCLVLHRLLHFQLMVHRRSSKFYAAFYLYVFKLLLFVSCLVDVFLKNFFFSFSQLNEVLVPNPFDRPRAVFMVEVRGVGGTDSTLNIEFSTSFHHFK